MDRVTRDPYKTRKEYPFAKKKQKKQDDRESAYYRWPAAITAGLLWGVAGTSFLFACAAAVVVAIAIVWIKRQVDNANE